MIKSKKKSTKKNKKSKNKFKINQHGTGFQLPGFGFNISDSDLDDFDEYKMIFLHKMDDGDLNSNTSIEIQDKLKNIIDKICNNYSYFQMYAVYTFYLDVCRAIIGVVPYEDRQKYYNILLNVFKSLDTNYTKTEELPGYKKTKRPTTYLCPNQTLQHCINYIQDDDMWRPSYYMLPINTVNKNMDNINLLNRYANKIDNYMDHLYKVFGEFNDSDNTPFYKEKLVSELVTYWMRNKDTWIKELDNLPPKEIAKLINQNITDIFKENGYEYGYTSQEKTRKAMLLSSIVFLWDIIVTINVDINWNSNEILNLT